MKIKKMCSYWYNRVFGSKKSNNLDGLVCGFAVLCLICLIILIWTLISTIHKQKMIIRAQSALIERHIY